MWVSGVFVHGKRLRPRDAVMAGLALHMVGVKRGKCEDSRWNEFGGVTTWIFQHCGSVLCLAFVLGKKVGIEPKNELHRNVQERWGQVLSSEVNVHGSGRVRCAAPAHRSPRRECQTLSGCRTNRMSTQAFCIHI